MKIPVFALLFLLLPATTLATPALPFNKGLVLDETLSVLAVNLYGPAFYSGIRPGDQLLAEGKPLPQNSMLSADLLFRRNDTIYSSRLLSGRLALPTQQSIFLLAKNRLPFTELLQRLQSDPQLAILLPVKSSDQQWEIIHTDALLHRSATDYDAYILANEIPAEIRLLGMFFFTPSEHNDRQILNINLRCQAKNDRGQWQDIPTTGLLQQEILRLLLQ